MKHSGFSGRIGVAREDITPPVGIFFRNWGAAEHDAATGIHRPLYLTALSIQDKDGGDPLILIDADLGWFADTKLGYQFLGRLCEALDLPPQCIILAQTHTHAAPPVARPQPEWKGGDLLEPFTEEVLTSAVAAGKCAVENARPATLEWHTGRCSLASDRDLPDGDRIVCGYNPAMRADDTVLFGRVTDNNGTIIATVTNYACHPTTLAWENEKISPDYVGAMRETIERDTGGAPALFLQGASGELGPKHGFVGDTDVPDSHGRQLGYASLSTLQDMNPPGHALVYKGVVESGAPIAAWLPEPCEVSTELSASVHTVDLPLKDWPGAAELWEQYEAETDRALKERLRRKHSIRIAIGDGDAFPMEFYVWRLGDAILCGTMAECYSIIQRTLREAFPDRSIIWMNLINGSIGYLPPKELYSEDLYQVWQTPFAAGSLEQLISEAREQVGALL